MMNRWIATVVLLVAEARRPEAAAHAAMFSGRAEDATEAFFGRPVGVADLTLYYLAVARVRESTLDSLPSVMAFYGGDALYFVIEHDEDQELVEHSSAQEVLDALGLKFMDQEEVDDV